MYWKTTDLTESEVRVPQLTPRNHRIVHISSTDIMQLGPSGSNVILNKGDNATCKLKDTFQVVVEEVYSPLPTEGYYWT